MSSLSFYALSYKADWPIKDKAHELQIEGWRKAVQLDPAGGTLFALTVLAEITVFAIQLLLLNVEGRRLKFNTIHTQDIWCGKYLTLGHTQINLMLFYVFYICLSVSDWLPNDFRFLVKIWIKSNSFVSHNIIPNLYQGTLQVEHVSNMLLYKKHKIKYSQSV